MPKKAKHTLAHSEPELINKLLDSLAQCKQLLKEYVYAVQPERDDVWEGCFTAWAAVNRAAKTIEGKLGQLPLPMQQAFGEREE